MFLVGPYSHPPGTLISAIQRLGLTSGLKLCLDAGDINSYPGSGQKWLDTSGNGHDFFRGDDANAESNDPTFNGSAGGQSSSEYFSGDGADFLTYDTSIETWMQALGKEGSSATILLVCRVPAVEFCNFVSTQGPNFDDPGFTFGYREEGANNRFFLGVDTTGSSAKWGLAGPEPSLPGTFFVTFSYTLTNGQPYISLVNGDGGSATITATHTSSNPTENMALMSRGDHSFIAASGSRMYALAIWNTALSEASMLALWSLLRSRFGL